MNLDHDTILKESVLMNKTFSRWCWKDARGSAEAILLSELWSVRQS